MGSLRRVPAAALAAMVMAAVLAPNARAGTYVVVSCQAPGAGGANNAWTPHVDAYPGVEPQPTAYNVAQECQPGGRGLYVESTGGQDARFLTSAYFKFTAPAGTRIVQLKTTRAGDKQRLSNDAIGDGWTVSANGDGNVVVGGVFGETCSIPTGGPSCSLPGTTPAPYPLNTAVITYGIACTRNDGTNPYNCPVSANGVPAARLGIRATEVTLSDDSAPSLTAGGPLLGGGWVPATATAAVTASDNVGIRAVRVLVDGAERTTAPGSCDFTRPLPCTDVPGAQVGLGAADLADGSHTVSVLAEDAAGNPARVDKPVLIDFHAPTVVVGLPSGGRVRASATDGASGLARLVITARDDRGGTEHALALARVRAGRTTARYGSIPARHLLLRVTAQDRAGNVRTDDGRPSAIAFPPARVGTGTRRVAHDRLRVPFGRSVTLRGRLVDAAGHGLAGRALTATATIRAAAARRTPAAGVTTDAKGRFTVRVPAGPSRVLRLAFDGGGGALRTARAVSLRVPATTTIAPSRRSVAGAGRVRFRGTVARRGEAIPSGGLTILLQGRQAGSWRTFKAARTDRRGRWRASYRFSGRRGTFAIRAYVRRSPSFPFDAGASRVVRVRVR
jgi:hypothetical protein